jgi:hypothetical protein
MWLKSTYFISMKLRVGNLSPPNKQTKSHAELHLPLEKPLRAHTFDKVFN